MDTTRHSGLIQDIDLHQGITIIGCGSLGTAIAETLVRMGFDTISLWDPDTVEEHNIANQLYDHVDIGQHKDVRLQARLRRINPYANIVAHTKRCTQHDDTGTDIIILATDDFESRRDNAEHPDTILLIDARMGGEHGRVIGVMKGNHYSEKEYWRTYPFRGHEAELPCTERSIIYTVTMTGALVAKMLKTFLQDNDVTYLDWHINLTGTPAIEELIRHGNSPNTSRKRNRRTEE